MYDNGLQKLDSLHDDIEEVINSMHGNRYRRVKMFIQSYEELGIKKRFELIETLLKEEAFGYGNEESQKALYLTEKQIASELHPSVDEAPDEEAA